MKLNNLPIRKKIVDKYGTLSCFASKLGIDAARLSRVLGNQATFKIRSEEVDKWKELLECSDTFLKPIIKKEGGNA